MKVVAVIQARMGSSRLKGKTLMKISEYTLLDTVINSAKRNKFIDEFVVATSTNMEDDVIERHCINNNIPVVRGESENVLSRFIEVSKQLGKDDVVVRITADNPFNNSEASNVLFQKHIKEMNDYTYVDGLSHIVYEFISVRALQKVEQNEELDNLDKEHVTLFFRNNKKQFKIASLSAEELCLNSSLDKLLTIDDLNDLNRIKKMISDIDMDKDLDFNEIYNWLLSR